MNNREIRDDEIRFIGGKEHSRSRGVIGWVIAAIVVVAVAVTLLVVMREPEVVPQPTTTTVVEEEIGLFEQEATQQSIEEQRLHLGMEVEPEAKGFCQIKDTVVAERALRIYIPHNARMSLHIGKMDTKDKSVIFTAQAADIRADNGKILGAFVMDGKEYAWGLSKKGFCASIDDKVTVGVSDNSPLFDEAVAKGGHFFRQYPLVKDGQIVENNPENVAVRRAICDRYGEIFMVESMEKLSFHDFSAALVALGVEQGIYLVGSDAYGWAVDRKGKMHEFGVPNYYTGRRRMPKNTSYIVWRRE